MVDFNFDLKPIFPKDIIRVGTNDLDETISFTEEDNENKALELQCIIDRMGRLSAMAQDLRAPITTAEKLKTSDNNHKVYLMAKLNNNNNENRVVGLLKVGKKDLFLYDEYEKQRKVSQVPCVLDFYIHEDYQRCGFGKKLFEKMLQEENWTPNKCSIDRPSEKLKGFLKKHYGLEDVIPQGYKFVLYKGFFDEQNVISISPRKSSYQNENNLVNNFHYRNNRIRADIANQKEPFLGSTRSTISNRPFENEFKSKRTSISLEHFGGCNLAFNAKRNRKSSKCCNTERPFSMVEVMQTLNKKR